MVNFQNKMDKIYLLFQERKKLEKQLQEIDDKIEYVKNETIVNIFIEKVTDTVNRLIETDPTSKELVIRDLECDTETCRNQAKKELEKRGFTVWYSYSGGYCFGDPIVCLWKIKWE